MELERVDSCPVVGEFESDSDVVEDASRRFEQTAWYLKSVEGFVVATDQPRRVPGGVTEALLFEKDRIRD